MKKNTFAFIKRDSIYNFESFCNDRQKTNQDIIEIFDGHEDLLLNWFTELSWKIWYLWDIKDNIPFFLETCKRLNIKPNNYDLKSILTINYNLIRNYFRNHILLKSIVKNDRDVGFLKNIIIQHILPITNLIYEEYWENMRKDVQKIEKSKNIYDMIYRFEILLNNIWKYLNSNESKIWKIEWKIDFNEFLNRTTSLHLDKTKEHLNTFHMVLNEIKPIDESIQSFLLYWSIAKNKTKATSDMLDWVLIIKNELIENLNDFKRTLNSIVKANTSLINRSKIIYKHPFHYMFEHDLSSMSPYYKITFNNNFKPIAWKNITNIDWFLDQEHDIYFWRYAFMNTFQKLRNEGRAILSKNDADLENFYRELKAFMKKWFILWALATQGIFIDEDQCVNLFKINFPDLEQWFTKILSSLETQMSHAEMKNNIPWILDFYSATIKHVYEL